VICALSRDKQSPEKRSTFGRWIVSRLGYNLNIKIMAVDSSGILEDLKSGYICTMAARFETLKSSSIP
jgi:hypothetical protein